MGANDKQHMVETQLGKGGVEGEWAECTQGLHHTEGCCRTVCAAASGDSKCAANKHTHATFQQGLLAHVYTACSCLACGIGRKAPKGVKCGDDKWHALYEELTSRTSSLMMRGMRMQISLTVFRPTVISSGRARSCTNWLHKCRMTGCNQSGGTRSWHACTDTHWQSVMLILWCRSVCWPLLCC